MRLRFRRTAAAACLGAASALLIAGCTAPAAALPGGPLGPAGNPSTQCTPGSLGHADTVGLISATNQGNSTLIVDGIDLVQPRGISLVGAYLTPGGGEAGVWTTFPPPGAQVSSYLDWSKRVSAVGAHIAPGETVSVTLGIEPTTTAGSSTSDVAVRYHDGGGHYELHTNLALKISVPPARCS